MHLPRSRRARGGRGYLPVAAFAVTYLVGAFFWPRPLWLLALYLLTSLVCFALYATDKRRAQAGGWRITERTLLFWGLIGGWPGAIVAQQVLRHKTLKKSFREAFWGTVVMNIVLFVAVSTPVFDRLAAQALDDFSGRWL